MNRRQLVLSGSTGVLAAVAGCLNMGGDSGSQEDDEPDDDDDDDDDGDESERASPTTVVREYLTTLYGGTAAEVNEFFHPDSEVPDLTQAQMQQYEDHTIEIDSVERLDDQEGTAAEESTGQAVETAELEASVTVDTGSRTISDTAFYELRTVDGEWKIYSIQS